MQKFDRAFAYLLSNEGGFIDDARDPGGATKYGITSKILSRWRQKTVTADDVRALTVDDAKAIYLDWWWSFLSLGSINCDAIAIALFDAAVLFGAGSAVRAAQEALNSCGRVVIEDGKMGPQTLDQLNKTDQKTWVIFFQKWLLSRLHNEAFVAGWTARIDRYTALVS